MTETSGAAVIVPAGAFTTGTTVRIAQDSTGAPAIPAELSARGSMYVITPHGGEFETGVEVRLPVPSVTLTPFQEFKIAKSQPGGEWVVLEDTVLDQGSLSAKVDSFSFFMVVVITYPVVIAQAEPMRMTTSLTCTDNRCGGLIGPTTATFTVTSNGGQTPGNCTNPFYGIGSTASTNISWPSTGSSLGVAPIAATGGSVTRSVNPGSRLSFKFGVGRKCGVNGSYSTFGYSNEKSVYWASSFGPALSIVQIPEQVDVVEGLVANVDVVMAGGAAEPADRNNPSNTAYAVPSRTNRAIIDWERSDDSGTSWRVVARSYQNEADSLPGGVGYAWRYWGIRHGFVATATDQGALLRIHACYTPPAPAEAPPCVDSAITRINVLQQSALPTIVDAPHSILVRTGQTASLSATASGLPAPTLQWQSRPANSTGAWSDVATGTGATTANYTTAALALGDNGTQYRMVATNAVGSVESTAVTVSVSDLDVAPTIATQPASVSVASGSDAVFAVDARGTEALSYQWYRNGSTLAGANSAVLRLTSLTILNSGSFTVRVSNAAGNVESNAAVLNVFPGTPAAVAPTIVTQPASLSVNVGNTATFAVGVDGSGPFTFQWRKDGVNIPGSTSAVLTLPGVTTGFAGSYSVIVSNAASTGVASSSATLTVIPDSATSAPTITTQPATLIVAPGGSGMLAVAAAGSGPLSYQWLDDGVPMGGETEAVLLFDNASESAEGRYSVRVSNSIGSIVSAEVQVILLGTPLITTQPPNRSIPENNPVTFFVGASGTGIHYQWLRNGLEISGATLNAYTTPMLTLADSGAVYTVIVFNSAGITVSQPAVLTVYVPVPPTVLQEPADVTIQAGALANLCVAFGGTPPFAVQMNRSVGGQWTPIGSAVSVNDNNLTCFSTPNLQLADNGSQFIFFASNAEGGIYEAMTRTVTVTVTAPSAITTTTLASRATSGATANNRSGLPSLSADGNLVAFTSDGTNLVPGATNPPAFGPHAYVRNLATGVTTLINQTPAGGPSMYGVNGLKLAAGGRYAIFTSLADDLVADDDNGSQDVFVRDLQTGTTVRASLRADGSQITNAGNGQSDMRVDISADGRWVSFVSNQDLIGNDPPGHYSLYLRSLQSGFLTRVASNTDSTVVGYSALSDNGEHMAYLYATFAPNPVRNIIVHYDAEANVTTEAFSIDSTNDASFVAQGISISGNGRYITFPVRSPTMFNGSTFTQVLAIDRNNPGHITIASGDSNGFGNGHSIHPEVSDDGHVLFMTNAGNLTGNLANGVVTALVVRDLQSSALTVASRRPNGTSVGTIYGYPYHAISSDGTVVAFVANELDVTGGTNEYQVYVAPRP